MAVNTYVVRLIDCSNSLAAQKDAMLTLITPWYRSVATAASSQQTTWNADVQWLDAPPSNTPAQDAGSPLTINVILFYVPDPGQSVIKLNSNYRGQSLPADGDSDVKGTTVSRWSPQGAAPGARQATLGISEIYVRRCNGPTDADTQMMLSRIGFHESMHNQMVRTENELHTGQGGGFAASVPTGNAPNPVNVRNLAATWSRLVPQWLDGFQAWRTASVDPLGWL